jgi:hypothetical protein
MGILSGKILKKLAKYGNDFVRVRQSSAQRGKSLCAIKFS